MHQDHRRWQDDQEPVLISTCEHPVILNSLDFIKAIRETLDSLL